MTPKYLYPLLFLFLSQSATPAILLIEDFEDATVHYTTNLPDDLSAIASNDYFGRLAPDTATPPASVSYTNIQGNGFFGAQDTDGAGIAGGSQIILDFIGIDIAGFTNLAFSALFAEDDASDGNEDWDSNTSLAVTYQIDGGGFLNLFAIENDGSASNSVALVDTDFDGVGDGAIITDAFASFGSSILGTGSLMDLRITLNNLTAGDEDIAFDNVQITGDSSVTRPSRSVPDSTSAWVLPSTLALLFGLRRKLKAATRN